MVRLNYENVTLTCRKVVVEDFADQIGERLVKARSKAGLTVDDVMFKTRIPRSVIVGLEAGDFTVFSSPTYAKSFLSQYSDYLNVDAQLWLDALEPSAFVAGGDLVPALWEDAGGERIQQNQIQGISSGSWSSALTFLVLTCGVLFAALAGYKYFESKFEHDQASDQKSAVEPRRDEPVDHRTEVAAPPKATVMPEPGEGSTEEATPEQRPPRAILVR